MDLRKWVEQLTPEEQKQFLSTIAPIAKELRPSAETKQSSKEWFMAEINVLKLEYLLTISQPKEPDESVVEQFASKSIRLYTIGSRLKLEEAYEAGCLAISSLGLLHHLQVRSEFPSSQQVSRGESPNERLLTQAGFLAQHLASTESGKQNRPLLLLAIRVLLFAGLGSLAFQLYPLVKVKEMLHETCSHVLLTGISQSHPLDATGAQKGSPDDELTHVINTLNRMTHRIDGFLSNDIGVFQFDQAFEMRSFKHNLRSSLTKHICALERRRLVRLQSGPMDILLNLERLGN